jgi:hypothetical protein
MNDLANPDLIVPGEVLRLPAVEHRCRRTWREDVSNGADDGLDGAPHSLQRSLFSPPSRRQPDQRRIGATAIDPPLH